MINKELIIERFKKSLKTYDEEAHVQRIMAKRIIELLIEHKGKEFKNIFEIGCGTGLLTREIEKNLSFKQLFINDIVKESYEYVKNIGREIEFLPGDIEEIEFPKDLDLIISNATFQWVIDIQSILKKSYNALNKKGILCFSTFGKKNFIEFKQLSLPSLRYNTYIKDNQYFKVIHFEESVETIHFKNFIDILKHIKKTGVNAVSKTVLTPYSFERIKEIYTKNYMTSIGLSLTYNPIFYILEKIQ